MSFQLITAPATEPVTLDEARSHLRVDFLDDDALIVALITAARLHAEMLTGRSFITTRWKAVLDSFPGPSRMGVPFGASFTLHASISSEELTEWIAYDQIEPIGETRAVVRTGLICSTFANVMGGGETPLTPADFMLFQK